MLASDMEIKKREQGRQEVKRLEYVSITFTTHIQGGVATGRRRVPDRREAARKGHLQGYCGVRSLLVASQQCLARTHSHCYSAAVPVKDKTTSISNPEELLLCGRHRCQMATLHRHEQDTANLTGRSIHEATLRCSVSVEGFFFFF